MNPIEVKVNCSFCSREIPCPESMIKAEKHACYDCFLKLKEKLSEKEIEKIHVAIPTEKAMQAMPEMVTGYAMEKVFPQFWKDTKEEFKEMSRKEVAEMSFLAGIQIAINVMKDTEEKFKQKKKL